jgi:hypothetical protein
VGESPPSNDRNPQLAIRSIFLLMKEQAPKRKRTLYKRIMRILIGQLPPHKDMDK